MKRLLLFSVCVLVIALWMPHISTRLCAQETEGTEGTEGTEADPNESAVFKLDDYPSIGKAMKLWETKRTEALANYVKKLNAVLIKERNKADLDFIQGVEKAIEKADTEHKGPCIVVDRLPPQIVPVQAELNGMKARLNKAFVTVIDREISLALTRKKSDQAERLAFFLYRTFLPESMAEESKNVLRLENRFYLFVESRMDWQAAYEWSRQRNGNLATVDSREIQARLYQHSQKVNQFGSRWIGGVKIMNSWQWTDGTPFKYTAWAGKPSGGRSETVLAFGYGPLGGWDDTNPLKPYNFITQWTLY